jgi:hypothetical protein
VILHEPLETPADPFRVAVHFRAPPLTVTLPVGEATPAPACALVTRTLTATGCPVTAEAGADVSAVVVETGGVPTWT